MNISRATFLRRTGPGVVDADTTKAVRVFEDVGADAVGVREFGARVSADAAIDSFGLAEPIAEGIEVVNRHDAQGEPAQFLMPIRPVRNAAHINRGENGLANRAII
ncbi:MAG: hypothetical protein E6L09_04205 [Verrucomicrobia bacterium]|nr:MAG: hypothetical protein E6L09_04205 [Verrucomicrobiota bacterium]